MSDIINITLPDGSIREFAKGSNAMDVALAISEGLARNVLAAKINDVIVDSTFPILENSRVQLLTWNDMEGKSTFWHSSAHIMAEAIEALYPGTKFGIGPAIENGFYYDIELVDKTLTQDDFAAIESKVLELSKQKNEFKRTQVSKKDAISYFKDKNDPYKLDLLEGLTDGSITFYQQGEFTDLCRGPHIPNTGFIKAVKLLNVAGAYWRGDEKNKMLTRIYAITFPKQKELDEYLVMLEEAKKRDHRKLGKELELFTFSEKVGGGLPLWLPKGNMLKYRLETFMRKLLIKSGYKLVSTPHIGHKQLYVTSGHYEKYGKDSFQPIKTPHEGEEFLLKPMNCPHHCEIYKFKPHSYKELPLRIAEFGTVYRYEQSGELHGLTRVRGFTQDDAHIFCTPEQVKQEFLNCIDLVLFVFKSLGFHDYVAQISLRDPNEKGKYFGTDEDWHKAESAIIEAAAEKGLNTVTEYGEAAFYGPKLDFMIKDAIGRKWQLGTIQVDYQMPQRFDLDYVGADNQKHTPVMLHRAPFGSLERFIAVLTEHCAGNFPLWLAPDQIAILPISDKYNDYAQSVYSQLEEVEITGFVDTRAEKIGRKIRDAEVNKVPFMLIVGEKEEADKTISIRRKLEGDLGSMSLEDFIAFFKKEAAV